MSARLIAAALLALAASARPAAAQTQEAEAASSVSLPAAAPVLAPIGAAALTPSLSASAFSALSAVPVLSAPAAVALAPAAASAFLPEAAVPLAAAVSAPAADKTPRAAAVEAAAAPTESAATPAAARPPPRPSSLGRARSEVDALADALHLRDRVTHYEHKECESVGGIKYDFLTISQLLDIEICLKLINKKNGDDFAPGYFSYNGKKTYIWDLPEEIDAYKSIWDGNTVSFFQINSRGMSDLVKKYKPNKKMDLAFILALERPGPKDYIDPDTGLNMVEEFILRRNGESEPDIKELAEILPDSYGTFIFQEDLGKVAKQLAGFSDEDAEILRENMAKKKMVELTKIRPLFLSGATKKVTQEVAEKIWNQMVTFGRYGFSYNHAISYGMITYACMFLRHYFKLEWWSAVLTNAEQKEITGVFWPHVKHLIASPDVNISTDVMEPDYAKGLIRSKLGVIKGMAEATTDPIVAARPYKDIQDFVNKDVAGPSLSHKLIHVGVLDSLFKPHMSLEEKLKAYQDAVEIKKYNDKKAVADKEGKKVRLTQPKAGSIPEQYVNLHPLKDAAMKKNTLPTLPIDLMSLGAKYSKIRDPDATKPKVLDLVWNKSVFLVDGPTIDRLDAVSLPETDKDIYVAATCYVIECKEFSYSKGTKRALKLILDCGSGSISEKVLWPDYQSGDLIYPKELSKGKIATIFFRKRAGKGPGMNIVQIVCET